MVALASTGTTLCTLCFNCMSDSCQLCHCLRRALRPHHQGRLGRNAMLRRECAGSTAAQTRCSNDLSVTMASYFEPVDKHVGWMFHLTGTNRSSKFAGRLSDADFARGIFFISTPPPPFLGRSGRLYTACGFRPTFCVISWPQSWCHCGITRHCIDALWSCLAISFTATSAVQCVAGHRVVGRGWRGARTCGPAHLGHAWTASAAHHQHGAFERCSTGEQATRPNLHCNSIWTSDVAGSPAAHVWLYPQAILLAQSCITSRPLPDLFNALLLLYTD
jgi:hypothetical protein